jgi:undecaprenyl-diphosphatase
MISASVAGLLADTTRGLSGRTRPNSGLEAGWFGPRHESRWVLGDARYHSFPSGHTATATGLVTSILIARRRLGFILLPLPLTVAAARICVGAHYFSDTVAGAALGAATALALARYSSKVPIARNPSPLSSNTSRLTG